MKNNWRVKSHLQQPSYSPPRIAIFLPSLKTLGGNRVLMDLSARLAQRGNDVTVYVIWNTGSTLFGHSELPIVHIGSRPQSVISRLAHLFKASFVASKLSRHQTVILSEPLLAICLMLIRSRGFVRFHQADDYALFDDNPRMQSQLALHAYRWLCKCSYRVKNVTNVFVSAFVLREYSRNGGHAHSAIARPGVNTEIFCPPAKRTTGSLKLGVMARDLAWKGFSDFSDAVRLVEISGQRFDEIVLIGHDRVEASFQSLCRQARPNNDRELAQLLQEIDIFVHASWTEGYGLPPLEAMACECAVIVSDAGGPAEYTADGYNCLLFKPKDTVELSRLLKKICDEPTLRSTLARNGVTTARRFSTDAFAHEFTTILKDTGHACANA